MRKMLHLQRKHLKIIGIIILVVALPLTLILVKTVQDQRSSAAAPDKLETEQGVLSSSGVTKQTDSGASGGQFIRFSRSSGPTPTSPPTQAGFGPRPAPPTPTGNNVYYIEDANIADNGTGQVGQQITDYINSLPDGSTVIFARRSDNTQGWVAGKDAPIRTYHLKRGIKVDKNLTLWGYGTRIEHEFNNSDHPTSAINVGYSRNTKRIFNVRILGFDYLGPHDSPESSFPSLVYEGQHFIHHRGITTTEIADNHMYAVRSDGINVPAWDDQSATQLNASDPNHPYDYIGLGGNGPYHWHHNNIFGVSRQGIVPNQNYNGHPELRDVNVSTIEYNHFANMGMMGIDTEDANAECVGTDLRLLEFHIQNNLFTDVNNLFGRYSSPWIGIGSEWGDCGSNNVRADHPEYVGQNVHPHLVEAGPLYIRNNIFASYDNPVHFENGGAWWNPGWGTGMTYIDGGIHPASTGSAPAGVPQGTYHDWYIMNNTWDTTKIPSNQVGSSMIQAVGDLKGVYNVTITGNKLNGISFDNPGGNAEGTKTISNNSR